MLAARTKVAAVKPKSISERATPPPVPVRSRYLQKPHARRAATAAILSPGGADTSFWGVEEHGDKQMVPLDRAKAEIEARDVLIESLASHVALIQSRINGSSASLKGSNGSHHTSSTPMQSLLELEEQVGQLVEKLEAAQDEAEDSKAALSQAMLHALHHLEDRVSMSFDEQYGEDKMMMAAELAEAQRVAESAKLQRDEEVAKAELKNARMAVEANEALESEVDVVIKLAQASAALSAQAAEEAGAASIRVVKQQAETLTYAKEMQKMAKEAVERAERSHGEAAKLAKEVELLRMNLTEAQGEAAAANQDALETEKRTASKLQEGLDALSRQQKELEDAYNMFKAGEKDRRVRAEEQAREDRLRNEELAAECSHLRESLSAALQAVAQTTSQIEDAEKRLKDAEQKASEAQEEAAKQMEAEINVLRDRLFLEAVHLAQAAVQKDLAEAKASMENSLERTAGRLESLEAALKRASSAKETWKRRALEAEETVAAQKLSAAAASKSDVKGSTAPLKGRGRAERYLRTGSDKRHFYANGVKGASIDHTSETLQGDWDAGWEDRGHPRPDGLR